MVHAGMPEQRARAVIKYVMHMSVRFVCSHRTGLRYQKIACFMRQLDLIVTAVDTPAIHMRLIRPVVFVMPGLIQQETTAVVHRVVY